jgi:hypothetical protein
VIQWVTAAAIVCRAFIDIHTVPPSAHVPA